MHGRDVYDSGDRVGMAFRCKRCGHELIPDYANKKKYLHLGATKLCPYCSCDKPEVG